MAIKTTFQKRTCLSAKQDVLPCEQLPLTLRQDILRARNCMQFVQKTLFFTLRDTTFYVAIHDLSNRKRLPFRLQKVTFWKLDDCFLLHKNTPFTVMSLIIRNLQPHAANCVFCANMAKENIRSHHKRFKQKQDVSKNDKFATNSLSPTDNKTIYISLIYILGLIVLHHPTYICHCVIYNTFIVTF